MRCPKISISELQQTSYTFIVDSSPEKNSTFFMLINPIKLISTAAFSSSLLERTEINFLRLTH
jgi:hypothetical protein